MNNLERFDWAETNGEGVLENPEDDGVSSMYCNQKFNIFVLDRETGIIYSGDSAEGTGSLADDVATFVKG